MRTSLKCPVACTSYTLLINLYFTHFWTWFLRLNSAVSGIISRVWRLISQPLSQIYLKVVFLCLQEFDVNK